MKFSRLMFDLELERGREGERGKTRRPHQSETPFVGEQNFPKRTLISSWRYFCSPIPSPLPPFDGRPSTR